MNIVLFWILFVFEYLYFTRIIYRQILCNFFFYKIIFGQLLYILSNIEQWYKSDQSFTCYFLILNMVFQGQSIAIM